MLNVRTTDITFAGKLCQIRLRDTKVGQRLDITEETDIVDPWLRRVFKKAFRPIYPGDTIAGMSPAAFRRVWGSAIRAVGLPVECKPYGLRRGGATAYFQFTGSFSKTADRGRWGTERAMKQYVTTALAELAEGQYHHDDNSTLNSWASCLNRL